MFNRVLTTERIADRQVQLPSDLALNLGRHLEKMKVLPAVAMQALEIARNADCSIARFSAVVERDAKLATDILRMSNSVVFSGGKQITSLDQAIARLGFRHCKNLIMSSCIGSLMRRLSVEDAIVRERLYRHGLLTGLVAANANKLLNMEFVGEEFTAGLIHDIGRPLAAMSLPMEFAALDPLDFVEQPDSLAKEQVAWGADHTDIGAWFAQRNHLPDSLIEVIQFHHVPERSNNNQRLVTLIAFSDQIANHVHLARRINAFDGSQFPALVHLEHLGVENAVERFSARAVELVNAAINDLANLNRVR